MPTVISNTEVAGNIWLLTVEGEFSGGMGQFYMLRAWKNDPLLSRPLSIFNIEPGMIQFLYKVRGKGTMRLARLKPGDSIGLEGPFGNGFPNLKGKIALVGGGVGIAPFYYAAKQLPAADVYLGFSHEPYLVDEFRRAARRVIPKFGLSLVNDLEIGLYDAIFACGPNAMMRALAQKAEHTGTAVYVSLEKHMACGIGACLVCSVVCKEGNRKACADGPVFLAREVNFDAEYGL